MSQNPETKTKSLHDQIQDIDTQISRLRNERNRLLHDDAIAFQKDAEKHIGECFKVDGRYVMVIGVPPLIANVHGYEMNQYQFPALWINSVRGIKSVKKEGPMIPKRFCLPIEVDTLFSAAWGEGHDMTDTKYERITPDEFYSQFCEVCHQMRLSVKDIVNQAKERENALCCNCSSLGE